MLKRNFTPKFKKRESQINGSEINNFRFKKAKFADLSLVLLFAIFFLLFSIDKTAVISKSPCFIYHNSFLFFTRFFWLFTLFYFLWFTALFWRDKLLSPFILCCLLFYPSLRADYYVFYVYFLSGRQSRPNRHLAAPIIVSLRIVIFVKLINVFVLYCQRMVGSHKKTENIHQEKIRTFFVNSIFELILVSYGTKVFVYPRINLKQ